MPDARARPAGRAPRGRRRPATPWLAYGDAASLLVFTVLGLRFHNVALGPGEVLRTAVPLWLAWFAAARVLGTYRRPAAVRFLLTWLLAVPAGLALRQLWLGRPFGPSFAIFVAVALGLTLVCLLVWRAVAMALRVRRSPRSA
ncbi:MAG: DUF3054 family protein [Candidatus Rokubacteria bacterium]|nr:DUF3054 family protein [Candidatus Rokubacteria bacterium]